MENKKIPDGWQIVKFGDIAKNISKRVEPSKTDLDIYVGLEHLDSDSLTIKRHGVPGDVEGQKLLVKKGQIIFGKRRAYQRKVGVAQWDCICSAHAMVLEANSKEIIPEFLPFFMQSDVFMKRAISISEGSLSPTIKWKSLEVQEFKIPTFKAQEKFLNALEKIEDCLKILTSLIVSSDTMKIITRSNLLFDNYFNANKKIQHKLKSLSTLVDINPCYKINKNVESVFCDMAALGTDSMYIVGSTETRPVTSGGSKFKNGDVLFARITPCAENGKMAIVDFLEENTVGKGSTEFIVLSPKNITSSYLYHLCRTERVRGYAIKNMEGTTGRQRIPTNVFDDIFIPVPSDDDIEKNSATLDRLEFLHEELKIKHNKIQRVKSSYLNNIIG